MYGVNKEPTKTFATNYPDLAYPLFPAKELQDINPPEAALWVAIARLL